MDIIYGIAMGIGLFVYLFRKKLWGFRNYFYPGFSNGCLFLLQVSPQTDVQGMDVSDDKNPHGVVNSGKKTGKIQ